MAVKGFYFHLKTLDYASNKFQTNPVAWFMLLAFVAVIIGQQIERKVND